MIYNEITEGNIGLSLSIDSLVKEIRGNFVPFLFLLLTPFFHFFR